MFFFARSLFVVFMIGLVLALQGCQSQQARKPHVFFLMLDTLRADHLGSYGYPRDTSPNLDAFTKDATRYEFAMAAAPWTPASVASMFTGYYPTSHKVMPPDGRTLAKNEGFALGRDLTTMAEMLQALGYWTGAAVSNPWITKEFQFDQGFEQFVFKDRATAEQVTRTAMRFIDQQLSPERESTQPLFIYMHYIDPHDPYNPPEPYREMFTGHQPLHGFEYPERMQQYINLYDGEIRYMDDWIGKFFDFLKERGLYQDSVIVVVADHGEQFMDHGNFGHGFKLFNSEIHVPLLIKSNRRGSQGRVVEETVSHTDLLPTILELVGGRTPRELPGLSLVSGDPAKRAGVLSEIHRKLDQKSFTSPDGKKLIMEVPLEAFQEGGFVAAMEAYKNASLVGVYDRRADYGERSPLEDPELFNSLRKGLDDALADAVQQRVAGEIDGGDISQEKLDQLRSLGYLN